MTTDHRPPTNEQRQLTLPFERLERAALLRQRILAAAPIPEPARRLLLTIAAHPGRDRTARARGLCVLPLRDLCAALHLGRRRVQQLIAAACLSGWLRSYANFRSSRKCAYAGQGPNVYRICYSHLRRFGGCQCAPHEAEAPSGAVLKLPATPTAANAQPNHHPAVRPPRALPIDASAPPPRTAGPGPLRPPPAPKIADFVGVPARGARPPARIPQEKQEKTTTTTNTTTTKQSKTQLESQEQSWGFRATNADLHRLDQVRRLYARAVALGWLADSADDAIAFTALVLWVRSQPGHDPIANPKGLRNRPGWLLWAIRGGDWRGWAEQIHWTEASAIAPKLQHTTTTESSNPDA